MILPKTPEQLAKSIESLVAAFVDESRQAAEQAVQRSFSNARRATKSSGRSKTETRKSRTRRSTEELSELGDKLYELVCAHPGESMTVFADETGVSVRELQRPMSKLKAEGRVRSVGERNLARYFPAVGRRSKRA